MHHVNVKLYFLLHLAYLLSMKSHLLSELELKAQKGYMRVKSDD